MESVNVTKKDPKGSKPWAAVYPAVASMVASSDACDSSLARVTDRYVPRAPDRVCRYLNGLEDVE
jgi:hypothetical protein